MDLHIEVSYSDEYFRYGPFGKDYYDCEVVDRARTEFFPRLRWMDYLEKLVIIKRGMSTSYPDECVKELITWIFFKYDMDSIERIWIQESEVHQVVSEHQPASPSIKSILLGDHSLDFDFGYNRFKPLQHIGGIGFSELAVLSNLRYVRGYCINSEVGCIMCFFFLSVVSSCATPIFPHSRASMNSVGHIPYWNTCI